MRKLSGVIGIIVVLVFPGMIMAQAGLTIAYPDFYPFFTRKDNGEMAGFFYEIISEALDKRMGVTVHWRQMPWKRCQEEVRAGRYDAMITVPTPERSTYCLTHQDPLYLKKMVLFTYAGHPDLDRIRTIESVRDIKAMGYSVVTYSGNGWHDKHISSLGIPSWETSEVHNVWKMLAAGRGDLAIEWPAGARLGMEKAGVRDKIIDTGIALQSMPFHLMIHNGSGHTRILNQFNRTINDMAGDGTMTGILGAYGITSF